LHPYSIVVEGITYTDFIVGFTALWNRRNRLEAAAAAQGVPLESLMTPEERLSRQRMREWDEEINARNRHTRREQHAGAHSFDVRLTQEVEAAGFSQIATFIQERMWYDGSSSPAATIERSGRLEVTTNADGTTSDHSRLGVTVSYTYDKATHAAVRKGAKEKKPDTQHDADVLEYAVSFGIGNFDREDILPEAQHLIGNDVESAKCYYIQRVYYSKENGYRTEMVAIPMGFEDSDKAFIMRLFEASDVTPAWLTNRRRTNNDHWRSTKKAA